MSKGEGGGRPTKLTRKTREKAKAYLNWAREQAQNYKNTGKQPPIVPMKEDFVLACGISTTRLYEWIKFDDKFREMFDELSAIQAFIVGNGSLNGQYNAPIAKLLLAKHGYVEKTETDLTTKGEKIAGFNYVKPGNPNDQTNMEAT